MKEVLLTRNTPAVKAADVAAAELRELGVTNDQMGRVTGMGHRSFACGGDATVLEKYRHGALSRYGVMGVLFGTDSPEHHAGTARRA